MSVIVKGMKMPENCRECPFENYNSHTGQTVCSASLRVLAIGFGIISLDGRHSSCPLVELPDKHGRLVDADALFREMEKASWYNNADRDEVAEELVLNAPTIVEAEGE